MYLKIINIMYYYPLFNIYCEDIISRYQYALSMLLKIVPVFDQHSLGVSVLSGARYRQKILNYVLFLSADPTSRTYACKNRGTLRVYSCIYVCIQLFVYSLYLFIVCIYIYLFIVCVYILIVYSYLFIVCIQLFV